MQPQSHLIAQQVMWTRLIAVVEEQAQALLRTAFGSVVREAGDLSAGVYDTQGRMLAQAVTGTPGHVNTMAMAVQHFLERFPLSSLKPGDVLVSNDPWLGTGHLFDFVTVTPAFLPHATIGDAGTPAAGVGTDSSSGHPKPVALFASTSHVTDVGGRGFTADALSMFEEGTLIPHMHIRRAGELNQELLSIIAANSRNPVEVLGDIRSLISCNDVGVRRLQTMMDEFGINELGPLAEHIFSASERATRNAIAAVPDGRYLSGMTLDGYEAPLQINTELLVNGDHISVNYKGSSKASRYGINSPKCYTDAYTVFGLKCVIAPDTPNNHASLSCFDVLAEPGSCVAPERPAPVTARHVIGQMLPDAVFGCLAQALPAVTPAESAGSIWVLAMSGLCDSTSKNNAKGGAKDESVSKPASVQSFNVMNVGLGGMGASNDTPGLHTTAFPSGVGGIPIEITETESPLVYRRKEFIADSGGAGRMPGGLGQIIEIEHTEAHDFHVSAATWDRFDNPPRGRDGGQNGRCGHAQLGSGKPLVGKTTHLIPAGDSLIVELPGGGGFGNPQERETAAVTADVEAGYISQAAASGIYKR